MWSIFKTNQLNLSSVKSNSNLFSRGNWGIKDPYVELGRAMRSTGAQRVEELDMRGVIGAIAVMCKDLKAGILKKTQFWGKQST